MLRNLMVFAAAFGLSLAGNVFADDTAVKQDVVVTEKTETVVQPTAEVAKQAVVEEKNAVAEVKKEEKKAVVKGKKAKKAKKAEVKADAEIPAVVPVVEENKEVK